MVALYALDVALDVTRKFIINPIYQIVFDPYSASSVYFTLVTIHKYA